MNPDQFKKHLNAVQIQIKTCLNWLGFIFICFYLTFCVLCCIFANEKKVYNFSCFPIEKHVMDYLPSFLCVKEYKRNLPSFNSLTFKYHFSPNNITLK